MHGVQFGWGNWFPDGKRILIGGNEPGHGARLFVYDVGGGAPRPISPEGVGFVAQAVSPDGKSIAARGPDGRIAIYPVDGGPARPVPGLVPEDVPIRWAADGRSLYVAKLSALPGIIDLVDVATGDRREWKRFNPPDPSGVEQAGPAMISPDGNTYVYSFRRNLGDLFLATGMR
jgi:dipeptidyl aminopeptidase/acylaminoacyl peptidase